MAIIIIKKGIVQKNTAFAIFLLKTVDDCTLVCYNFVMVI